MEFHLFKRRNVSLHRAPRVYLIVYLFSFHSFYTAYPVTIPVSVEQLPFSLFFFYFSFSTSCNKNTPVIHFSKLSRGVQHLFHFLSMYTRIYLFSISFFSFSRSINLYYALSYRFVIAINGIFPPPFFSIHFSKFTGRRNFIKNSIHHRIPV